ncbi:MAG: winged helix-turn-helix domain-containing protein [Candidatus Methylumidiphilus sp.]
MPKITKKSRLPAGDDATAPPSASVPRLKLSLRLLHGAEIAFGPGKAELLEAIARTGSISAAGKSMDMSYRRAWQLVDVMNRCFKSPLVETAKGGNRGGGARLTPLGAEALARSRAMEAAAWQVSQAYLGMFDGLMAEMPSSPKEDDEAAPPALG